MHSDKQFQMNGKRRFGKQVGRIILVLMLFCRWSTPAAAQSDNLPGGRIKMGFNDAWFFGKDEKDQAGAASLDVLKWKKITLPHTWNAKDVLDDEPGYYRGTGWYKKSFKSNMTWKNKSVFLCFDGVNQETEVYVNGRLAGSHKGGYTGFVIPIGHLLKFEGNGWNDIAVKVSNRYNEDIAPLTADFTFFGGIYRNVNLLVTEDIHFSKADYGSDGIYIRTPLVSDQKATIQTENKLENASGKIRKLKLITVLFNAEGKKVAEKTTSVLLAAGESKLVKQDLPVLQQPNLWSVDRPYLYRIVSRITDAAGGDILDQVSSSLGLRWFKFDAEKGFFLNGKALKLVGASRHQDYQGIGNAVPEALQIRDVELLKAMGGNFLRVAHYPQDPVILESCDRLGILASVEIPIVNAITESEAFTAVSKNMQMEMIRQNFNHPSVVIWAYMNEVLLRPKFGNDKIRQQLYFDHIRELAQSLEDLTRKEDPSRYTMMACHGDFDRYHKVGLTKIPMIVGWNLYQGWYSAGLDDFAKFLDKHHQVLPDKPLLVTEYGADADPRIRSFRPVRFDKSIEYAINYHQVYFNAVLKRPFVSGAMAWNLADFNSETREETMPHINNKGLLTLSRQAKDTYFLYQAYLLDRPFLKISSELWRDRAGISDPSGTISTQPVQVVTNLTSAELFLNGKSLGIRQSKDKLCEWEVPFKQGENSLRTVDPNNPLNSDQLVLNFNLVPQNFTGPLGKDFHQLNILLGADRYFIDQDLHQVWIPDQPYQQGSWGWIGGNPFKGSNNRISYGSDKNILNTDLDPVYQTQRVDIKQYKMDVPDGDYELNLLFSELIGGIDKEALAYNLDNNHVKEKAEERIFSVLVNGKVFLKDLNLAENYGYATAVKQQIRLNVTDGKGITVDFIPVKGKPVLNAMQLRKIN
jgi:beta-galactosidase